MFLVYLSYFYITSVVKNGGGSERLSCYIWWIYWIGVLNNIIKSDCDFKLKLETVLLKDLNVMFSNIFVDILSIL